MRIRRRPSLQTQFLLDIQNQSSSTTTGDKRELHLPGVQTHVESKLDQISSVDPKNSKNFKQKEVMVEASSSCSSQKTLDSKVHNESSKKRKPAAVTMEGSRCSRVNGRGWRCSQLTLIGYSLCEHHLGKGRIKSINSVNMKNSSSRTRTPTKKMREEEENIGTVKARSINNIFIDAEDHSEGSCMANV